MFSIFMNRNNFSKYKLIHRENRKRKKKLKINFPLKQVVNLFALNTGSITDGTKHIY